MLLKVISWQPSCSKREQKQMLSHTVVKLP